MSFDMCIPTRIVFGPGKLNELASLPLPGKKALVVISQGASMRRLGFLDRTVSLLAKQGVDSVVFDKILANPVKRHIEEGSAVFTKEGCDFLVGLGGGSTIDSAKAIGVLVANGGDYWDYIGTGTGKGKPLSRPAMPVVAIPTTAGTGTEADPWTVITNEETDEKIGFGVQSTFPVLSIVDPQLMTSVSPTFTAYQGFDALFHSTEGYIANIASEISDLYALKAISLIAAWLPVAVREPQNIEARTHVAFASTLSGLVESTSSCTSSHAMEHALSAFHPELPHGAGLIMLSEGYYRFFAGKVDGRMGDMAEAMGRRTDGKTGIERDMVFVEALLDLQRTCNVDKLDPKDFGAKAELIDAYTHNARSAMSRLFDMDRYNLSFEETKGIISTVFQ